MEQDENEYVVDPRITAISDELTTAWFALQEALRHASQYRNSFTIPEERGALKNIVDAYDRHEALTVEQARICTLVEVEAGRWDAREMERFV